MDTPLSAETSNNKLAEVQHVADDICVDYDTSTCIDENGTSTCIDENGTSARIDEIDAPFDLQPPPNVNLPPPDVSLPDDNIKHDAIDEKFVDMLKTQYKMAVKPPPLNTRFNWIDDLDDSFFKFSGHTRGENAPGGFRQGPPWKSSLPLQNTTFRSPSPLSSDSDDAITGAIECVIDDIKEVTKIVSNIDRNTVNCWKHTDAVKNNLAAVMNTLEVTDDNIRTIYSNQVRINASNLKLLARVDEMSSKLDKVLAILSQLNNV
jgi:hypothetical protein